jgi:hypothetical protein
MHPSPTEPSTQPGAPGPTSRRGRSRTDDAPDAELSEVNPILRRDEQMSTGGDDLTEAFSIGAAQASGAVDASQRRWVAMARKAGGGARQRPLPRGLARQVYCQRRQTVPLGRVLHS